MFNSAIIIFREMLEISLIISIISLATKNIKSSKYYIIIGGFLGIVFSVFVVLFFSRILKIAEGRGVDFLNIFVLTFSVIMMNWTISWMKPHIKEIKERNIQTKDVYVDKNNLSSFTIIIIVAGAILREMSEIILYFYSMILTKYDKKSIITGLTLGSLLGVLLGIIFHFSLSSVFKKYIFSISNWILIILAASISSNIPDYFISTNIFNFDTKPLWDSSFLIPDSSLFDEILKATIGYRSKPYKAQLIFYFSSLAISFFLYKQKSSVKKISGS